MRFFYFFGIGLVAAAALKYIGKRKPAYPVAAASDVITPVQLSATPDTPQPFGYKTTWLAVKASNSQAVFDAMGFTRQETANWETGMRFAYSGKYTDSNVPVFVTPPVDGWVLVVIRFALSSDSEGGIAKLEALLSRLSTQFGESQFFGNYRVTDYIAWYQAIDGEIKRGFSFADGVLYANTGQTTSAELDNGIIEMSGMDEAAFWDKLLEDEGTNLEALDEEAPMRIAGVWSVNPLVLDANIATGLVGMIDLSE